MAFIDFRDSFTGRQAYIEGSSLAVWEVVMIVRACGDEVDRAAAHLQWPIYRVQAAVNYALAHRAEIDGAIEDNAAYDADRLRAILPRTRVFSMHDGKLVEEAAPHATPSAG